MQDECGSGFGRELLSQVQQHHGEEFAIRDGILGKPLRRDRLGKPGAGILLPRGGLSSRAIDRAAHAHRRQPSRPRPHSARRRALRTHRLYRHLRDDILGMAEVAEHPVCDAKEPIAFRMPGCRRRGRCRHLTHGSRWLRDRDLR